MTVESDVHAASSQTRLGAADRLQPVFLLAAIGIGLAIGRLAPAAATIAANAVSAGVFVLIALVLLNVNPRNVAATFARKRFLAAAIMLNFAVNPVMAWVLGGMFLADEPDLRIGLILFLVTPCIGWYLIFTEIAGGDTELGVGLLGVNVILQILLLPVYLALFVGAAGTVDIATILRSIALYLVLPAVAAAAIRGWWAHQGRSASVEQERLRLSACKTATLAVVIVSMFASQSDAIFDDLDAVGRLVAPMVSFFVLAYCIAVTAARRLGLPHDQTALLVFTTSSRNSEASLAIAATAFVSPLVGLTVALGPVIELPLLVIMTRLLRRRAS